MMSFLTNGIPALVASVAGAIVFVGVVAMFVACGRNRDNVGSVVLYISGATSMVGGILIIYLVSGMQ